MWKSGAVALLSLIAATTALAQDKDKQTSVFADGKFSFESDFSFAIVGTSNFELRAHSGDVDAYNLGSRNVLSYKAREGFLVRFGFELQRYNFGVPSDLALPSKLQAASLVIGTDLQLGDAWIIRLEVQPGYYGGSTKLRAGNFDAPFVVGASYFVSSDLQLVAGLSIDVERKYPVLPGIGFRYKYNADVVLDFILPTPRIEYTLNKSVLLYAGGDVQSNTYRVDSDFGTAHGLTKLNDAWVDYTQIRIGGGATWKISPEVTLELEAGVVPVQEFDFHRANIRTSGNDIPPYGGVVLRAAF
ncbi:MAG: DUF6268 family outer membrane beta-barrel protein [Chthoniobacter sp.]|uniref:DUF6268 family outer membrane beta-barrel protein n=1 Tax=Chthoniobacter sp. TaxID=2510640 RepID=UPI0032A9FE4A